MRGRQPWQTNRSRVLRSQPISAEAKLWRRLRNRQLAGLKFVRQSPIGPYFVDFLCRELNVVVEIDGGTHSTGMEIAADAKRAQQLELMGCRVFRTHNIDVYDNVDAVLDMLLTFIEEQAL